jgi:hypothetical protein
MMRMMMTCDAYLLRYQKRTMRYFEIDAPSPILDDLKNGCCLWHLLLLCIAASLKMTRYYFCDNGIFI